MEIDIIPKEILFLEINKVRNIIKLDFIDVSNIDRIYSGTPDNLKHISHYALAWNIGEDSIREDQFCNCSLYIKNNLIDIVVYYRDDLDLWLAGESSYESPLSVAYLAFANMTMTVDCS
jgi:hypothetical protein